MRKTNRSKKIPILVWIIFGILILAGFGLAVTTITDIKISTPDIVTTGQINASNINGVLYVQAGNGSDIQSKINLCASSGCKVIIPAGKYNITSPILMRGNLTIQGDGIGKTILMGGNNLGNNATIYYEGSTSAILSKIEIKDLEIDGTNMNRTGYSVKRKGIFITYVNDSHFSNLYIYNTPATCLGTDFMINTLIENVKVENCGTINQEGSNGIGIGTGLSTESVIITNSRAIGVANKGIMIEEQGSSPIPKSYIISNSMAIRNTNGFSVSGTHEVILSNLIAKDNTQNGIIIHTDTFGNTGINKLSILNSNIVGSGAEGILMNTSSKIPSDIIISNNYIGFSTKDGVSLNGSNLIITDNIITNNTLSGLVLNGGDNIILKSNIIQYNQRRGLVYLLNKNATNLQISDNLIKDNGLGGSALFVHGIDIKLLAANVYLDRCLITNNIITDSKNQSSKKQVNGIYLETTAGPSNITNCMITNNNLFGNKNIGLNNTIGQSSTLYTYNNLGGSSSISSSIIMTSNNDTDFLCSVNNSGAFTCN